MFARVYVLSLVISVLLPMGAIGNENTAETLEFVEVIGLTSGRTYVSSVIVGLPVTQLGPALDATVGGGCVGIDCPSRTLPVNEWTLHRYQLRPVPAASPNYVGATVCFDQCMRTLTVFSPSKEDGTVEFLLPPPRHQERELTVTVDAFTGSEGERLITTFPVAGTLPRDPREHIIYSVNGWVNATVELVKDSTAYVELSAAMPDNLASTEGQATGSRMVFVEDDRTLLGATGGMSILTWAHEGAAGAYASSSGDAVVDATLLYGAELRQHTSWMGAIQAQFQAGEIKIHHRVATAGIPPESQVGLTLFSLVPDAFLINMTVTPLQIAELDGQGFGTTVGAAGAGASHGTLTRSMSVEERQGVVFARADSGNGGVVRLEHDGDATTEPLPSDDEWRLVRGGDCSGRWSVSLRSTSTPITHSVFLAHAPGMILSPRLPYIGVSGAC